MVEGIGSWKNLDEIEESLILDELLLLNEMLSKSKHNVFKMHAIIAGANPDDMEEESDEDDDEALPPELIAAEKAWKEKKRKAMEKGVGEEADLEKFGIGYTKS